MKGCMSAEGPKVMVQLHCMRMGQGLAQGMTVVQKETINPGNCPCLRHAPHDTIL